MDMVKDYMTEIGLKVEGEELERDNLEQLPGRGQVER